jgi:hypothetical protein
MSSAVAADFSAVSGFAMEIAMGLFAQLDDKKTAVKCCNFGRIDDWKARQK